MEQIRIENLMGGVGPILKRDLLLDPHVRRHCRLYAELTLLPGSSIGENAHVGESETYYILSGSGILNDNGTTRRVGPGDAVFTGYGQHHGLVNDGAENLVLMALVMLD